VRCWAPCWERSACRRPTPRPPRRHAAPPPRRRPRSRATPSAPMKPRATSWCRYAPCCATPTPRPAWARAFLCRQRPHHHQLPRGQPARAGARALPRRLRAGGRQGGRGRAAGLRRAQRPGPAAREGPGRGHTAAGLSRRRSAAGARRTHLFAGQPAGHRLCRDRRHLQRPGAAQFLPAHLFRRRAQPRHERRPGARRRGPGGRHQCLQAAGWRPAELFDPRRIRPGPAGQIRLGPAHHQARACRSRAPARRAPGPADAALHRRSR
jgi:hypothetical protein